MCEEWIYSWNRNIKRNGYKRKRKENWERKRDLKKIRIIRKER